METEIGGNAYIRTKAKKPGIFAKKVRGISDEDKEIVMALNDLNREINSLHLSLDNITDPDLIDAHIYEIKAVGMRYKYYLEMCKQKGIVADVF